MVTLNIAQLLADAGFGTLDENIFWEDAPLSKTGKSIDCIWIVPRGAPLSRFSSTIQNFDIYSRYANKIVGSQKLEAILIYLQEAYNTVCELPIVPGKSEARYYNCQISPTSGIENVGSDEQDKIVRVISGKINYNKEQE